VETVSRGGKYFEIEGEAKKALARNESESPRYCSIATGHERGVGVSPKRTLW